MIRLFHIVNCFALEIGSHYIIATWLVPRKQVVMSH